MNTLEEILQEGFASLGLSLPEEACARYRTYYTLLEEKNRVMNLTAITGEENVARLHFLDCAALLRYTAFAGKAVYDIGTGAGFPGLALKIACPEMNLTLLDSLDKRIGFLKEVCSALGFETTPCLHARAEEAAKDHREKADIVTSRAAGAGRGQISHPPSGREGGNVRGLHRAGHGDPPQRDSHPEGGKDTRSLSPQMGTDQKSPDPVSLFTPPEGFF